jgi:hypothetical protein
MQGYRTRIQLSAIATRSRPTRPSRAADQWAGLGLALMAASSAIAIGVILAAASAL